MTDSQYEWYLKQDFSRYDGKWIAIADNKVVASNRDVRKVMNVFTKKYPKKIPFLAKIDYKLSIFYSQPELDNILRKRMDVISPLLKLS